MFKNNCLRILFRACCWLALFCASHAAAEVVRIDISKTADLLGGRSYGAAGAYEWIEGRAHFTLDPNNPRNAIIVDLKLAPRNARGLVEFSADIGILRPKSAARANGVVILDVVNRGRHTILEYLNRGNRTAAPASADFIGDDFLMKQGVTLVWLGWQQDLPHNAGMMRLTGPVAEGIEGRVYGEFTVPARVTDVSLGDRTSIPYAVDRVGDAANKLGVSPSRSLPPREIPQANWAYARLRDGVLSPDPMRLHVEGGFVPGAIYQFAYGARNPQIAGLGLAGVRDLVSWIRHDNTAIVRATHAYAFGISQSGQFLRQFLHEGFNEDTAGRQVFDGMMVHIAGGARRGFNERFSQPSRTTGSRVFPFTDLAQTDRETGESGGLLTRAAKAGVVPKKFFTPVHRGNTGAARRPWYTPRRRVPISAWPKPVVFICSRARSTCPRACRLRTRPLRAGSCRTTRWITARRCAPCTWRWINGCATAPSRYPAVTRESARAVWCRARR